MSKWPLRNSQLLGPPPLRREKIDLSCSSRDLGHRDYIYLGRKGQLGVSTDEVYGVVRGQEARLRRPERFGDDTLFELKGNYRIS